MSNDDLAVDRKLPWMSDEAAAFAKARAEGKGVMLFFTAAWCLSCAELEHTFGDDEVFGLGRTAGATPLVRPRRWSFSFIVMGVMGWHRRPSSDEKEHDVAAVERY